MTFTAAAVEAVVQRTATAAGRPGTRLTAAIERVLADDCGALCAIELQRVEWVDWCSALLAVPDGCSGEGSGAWPCSVVYAADIRSGTIGSVPVTSVLPLPPTALCRAAICGAGR